MNKGSCAPQTPINAIVIEPVKANNQVEEREWANNWSIAECSEQVSRMYKNEL